MHVGPGGAGGLSVEKGKVSRAEGAVRSSGRPKGEEDRRVKGTELTREVKAAHRLREKAAALPVHESVTLGWDQSPRLGSP